MLAVSPSTRHAVIDSPIGPLTIVRDDEGITGLYYPGHWTRPDPAGFGPRVDVADDRGFDAAVAQLGEYFAGARREFALPLTPHGSPAAHRVWKLLAEIPYGQTTTYGTLAREIGGTINARAVGGFVGRNPLSIFIPCHRVVGSTGQLTGYAGGLDRKQHLLELEGVLAPGSPRPAEHGQHRAVRVAEPGDLEPGGVGRDAVRVQGEGQVIGAEEADAAGPQAPDRGPDVIDAEAGHRPGGRPGVADARQQVGHGIAVAADQPATGGGLAGQAQLALVELPGPVQIGHGDHGSDMHARQHCPGDPG